MYKILRVVWQHLSSLAICRFKYNSSQLEKFICQIRQLTECNILDSTTFFPFLASLPLPRVNESCSNMCAAAKYYLPVWPREWCLIMSYETVWKFLQCSRHRYRKPEISINVWTRLEHLESIYRNQCCMGHLRPLSPWMSTSVLGIKSAKFTVVLKIRWS